MKKRVGIIGGGAGAGGCHWRSQNGAEVTVIEHMDWWEKKSFLQATADVILPIIKWRKIATAAAGRIFLCR